MYVKHAEEYQTINFEGWILTIRLIGQIVKTVRKKIYIFFKNDRIEINIFAFVPFKTRIKSRNSLGLIISCLLNFENRPLPPLPPISCPESALVLDVLINYTFLLLFFWNPI